MTNHYIQMSSDQYSRTIELGEVIPDAKIDGNLETRNMVIGNSPDVDPVFTGLRSGSPYSRRITWDRILIILIFIITIILLLLLIILLCSTLGTKYISNNQNNEWGNISYFILII